MYVYINTRTQTHQSTQINFPILYSRFKVSFNGGESFTAIERFFEAAIESWKVDLSGLVCVCVSVFASVCVLYIHTYIYIYMFTYTYIYIYILYIYIYVYVYIYMKHILYMKHKKASDLQLY